MLALKHSATGLGSLVPAHRVKPIAEAHRSFLDNPSNISLCEKYCITRSKLDSPRCRSC